MRLALVIGIAALAVATYALTVSGDEPTARPPAARAVVVEKPELPPLPELRPTVVEPEAGNLPSESTGADPGLSDACPKPTEPASAGAHPRRTRHTGLGRAGTVARDPGSIRARRLARALAAAVERPVRRC